MTNVFVILFSSTKKIPGEGPKLDHNPAFYIIFAISHTLSFSHSMLYAPSHSY